MSEAYFSVTLLFACYLSVFYLFQKLWKRHGIRLPRIDLAPVSLRYFLYAFRDLMGISGIGIVLAIWILSDSLKPEVTEKEVEKAPEPRYSLVRRLVLFADFFLFIFLYSIFGFLPAAIIFTFLFMLFFDDKIEKVPFKIIVSVVIAAAVFLVYTEFFGVHF